MKPSTLKTQTTGTHSFASWTCSMPSHL